jgi:hypothetical protein
MVRIARSLLGWLRDRQPRIVDYIAIAVIAGIPVTLMVEAAGGGGQGAKSVSSGSSGSTSVPTSPETATVARAGAARPTQQTSTSPAPTAQAFYAPDANVSCSLQSESAQCSVASADLTFVIPKDGGHAYMMSGLSVPLGAGSEAPYGTEWSDGVIFCDIPPESVAAGVTCRDTTSGHGFEASRVASRQSVY